MFCGAMVGVVRSGSLFSVDLCVARSLHNPAAGFKKQNDPLSSPILRLVFRDTATGKAVKVPLFFMTWYDFDSDRNGNAVESMCIERSQFDRKQSSFTANEYVGYVEVNASDTESVKKYFEKAFPRREMLSDADLARLGQRLNDTACFIGACVRAWVRGLVHFCSFVQLSFRLSVHSFFHCFVCSFFGWFNLLALVV